MPRSGKAYRLAKIQELAALAGKPHRCRPEEFEALRRHLFRLHNAGMTTPQISYESGVVDTVTVGTLISGVRNRAPGVTEPVRGVRRSTYDALMRVRYVPPDGAGARVDPSGTRRRLQALAAAGYPTSWVSEQLGQTRSYLNRVALGREIHYVHWSTREAVRKLYEQYELKNPLEAGLVQYSVSRAKMTARKHGYAPPHTWDADTIDDPQAHPEWTGACGSGEGYRIHQREGIPVCPACTGLSKVARRALAYPGFSGSKLRQLRWSRDVSLGDLAQQIGVDKSAIMHWEAGRSVPRESGGRLEKMLVILDADLSDVTEDQEK